MSTTDLDVQAGFGPTTHARPPAPVRRWRPLAAPGPRPRTSGAGVLTWYRNGKITEANRRLLELVGSDFEEVCCRSWTGLFVGIPHDSRPPYIGEAWYAQLLRADGTSIPVILIGAQNDSAPGGRVFVLDRAFGLLE